MGVTMANSPDDLLSEEQVYQQWGHLLVGRELREARKAGRIGWYDLRTGPHYSVGQVMDYLRTMEVKPRAAPTNVPLDLSRGVPDPGGRRAG